MSYMRVIPRDLFNEASLLKGWARLSLHLHDWPGKLGDARIYHLDPEEGFHILQDPSDGSIYVRNLSLKIRNDIYVISRPLNSRSAWPLYLRLPGDPDFEDMRIFAEDNDTDFTPEFIALCQGG